MESLISWLKRIPESITQEDYQRYQFFKGSTILVFFGHILFLVFTIWLGDQKIVNLGYIAILVDLVAVILIYTGKLNLAVTVVILYISYYTSVCIKEFGLNTSFSLYFIALIGFIFLTSWSKLFKIVFSGSLMLLYILTAYYLINHGARFNLEPNKTFMLNILNIVLSGTIISYIVYTYENNAKMAKAISRNMHNSTERLYSIIAHDLRTPIGSMAGLSKILVDYLEKENIHEKPLRFAKTIAKTSKDSNALLENLLAWTQNQQGDIAPDIKEINIRNLIENCTDLHNTQIEDKRLNIINKCKDEAQCVGDEKMIFTVIRNLISNAIKFSHIGGKVVISESLVQDKYTLIVEDSGVGIPKELLHELFYNQSKKVRLGTKQEKGTGLGLILCKELIEKNNGMVWIESKLNNGTKVFFTLPIKN